MTVYTKQLVSSVLNENSTTHVIGGMSMKKFMTIAEACEITGLSQIYLRKGCRDGSIPRIKNGVKYLINMPMLLQQLDAGSTEINNYDKNEVIE